MRGSASCAAAKRLVKAVYRAEVARKPDGMDPTFGMFWRVQGWKCFTGLAESQVFCHRGANRIDGSLRKDDGWVF